MLDRGDIFRLSRILGHSSVTITQNVYAHLVPDAWEQDYHRVAFVLPAGSMYALTQRKPSKLPVLPQLPGTQNIALPTC